MIGTILLSLAIAGQPPDIDPESLITRLGASRYQEREAAAEALERLGREALPALVGARNSRDPEVRLRVAGLIERIEGRLLTEPTLLRLDFQDAPLLDVVKSLSEQAGIRLMLVPETSPQWPGRRVTVRESIPLPFWQALDRLCDAASIQYNVGAHAFPQGRERVFPLYDGGMRATAPYVDSGPFRVSVLGLHFQRDITFPPTIRRVPQPPIPGQPPQAATAAANPPQLNEQCHVQMQVVSEPRLSIAQNGTIRISEAVDDRGQILAESTERAGLAQRSSAYFGMAVGPALQLQTVLKRPEQPGKRIKRLQGTIPVTVATRKPDPLNVRLDDPADRVARKDDLEVTIHEVKVQENSRQTTIELSVRSTGGEAAAEATARGPAANQQQIEIVDAQGRILTWYQTGFNAESERLTLTLVPQGGDANQTPTALRYYSLVRANTEIPFDFRDLPLP